MFIEVCKGEMTISGICFKIFLQEKGCLMKQVRQNFENCRIWVMGVHYAIFPTCVCLKFFIYKITKQNKNPCFFHYNHSFQTWACLRIHISCRILGLIPQNSDFVCLGSGSIFNKSSRESSTYNLQTYLKIIHLD